MDNDAVHEEQRDVVARNLPGLAVRSIDLLGEGMDNAAWEVNDELIVRQATEEDAGDRADRVQQEAALLCVVARHSILPVPEVVFVDADAGVLAYRKLPGQPLHTLERVSVASIAPLLGQFVGRIHDVPIPDVLNLVEQDQWPMRAWLEGARRNFQQVADALPEVMRGRVEAFLGNSTPAEPGRLVFSHNDLGAEHVLVDPATGNITGVIDWSDAAITDPSRDLALIYRDLGPAAFEMAIASYTHPFDAADRDRAVFLARCKVLEDIAYGIDSGANRYVENGIAHLEWLFA